MKKNRDHIIINQRWRWMLMRWWFFIFFYWCKCRTWTKILKRNFSLTANWPLNQLFLLRYANDREAERWLKLPFNSTLHCLTLDKKLTADERELQKCSKSPSVPISSLLCACVRRQFHQSQFTLETPYNLCTTQFPSSYCWRCQYTAFYNSANKLYIQVSIFQIAYLQGNCFFSCIWICLTCVLYCFLFLLQGKGSLQVVCLFFSKIIQTTTKQIFHQTWREGI